MAAEHDDILDGLWHGCALAAYLDQAAEERGWPSSEGTRRRAYDYYEQALRAKDAGGRGDADAGGGGGRGGGINPPAAPSPSPRSA